MLQSTQTVEPSDGGTRPPYEEVSQRGCLTSSSDRPATAGSIAALMPPGVLLARSAGTVEQGELQIRNLIASYEQIAEWIRFADTKAAVVLTVNGLLASFLIPTISELTGQTPGGLAISAYALFVGWALLAAWSCLRAVRCILPRALNEVHPAVARCPHFHPAAIAARYPFDQRDEFVEDFERLGCQSFRNQILHGMVIEANISTVKYRHVIASIRLLAAVAPMGLAYLALVQLAT
jgi:hypothetical protein